MIKAFGGDGDRTFAYTPYDLPSTLTLGAGASGRKVGYEYGPNREKIRRLDYASANAPSTINVTHYVGNAEVRLNSTAVIQVRRYVGPLLIVQSGLGSRYKIERQYFLTDAQGSTSAVLSDWGVPLNASAAPSFDPFGARRDPASGRATAWSGTLQAELDAATRHGYTGHEQVDSLGVIHMNGRIYDPLLGRFLQADPYVQDPLNGQSLNRYSYVLNNPFLYTDPSGYWGHKEQAYLKLAGAIVISVWTGGAAAGLAAEGAWGQAMAVAFAGGFASGALQSGTGKGGLTGGLSAMAFAGIGGGYARMAHNANRTLGVAECAERALAMGAAAGLMAMIQGQRFGNAFASAGLGSALSPLGDHVGGNTYAQGFVAAIVGGTVSEATGGKFANGAVTAAFAYAVGRVVMRGSVAPSDNQLTPLEEARTGNWPSAQVANGYLAQLSFAMGWLHEQGLLDPQFNFAFESPGLLDFQYNDYVKKHPFSPGFALGAEAPLDGSPIQFYRSGVQYNMVATFRTFAHEVLHRNPLLAALYRSLGDPSAVHTRMLTPVQSAQDAYRRNQPSIDRAWDQR